jgi:hypothetical protein
MIFGADTFNYGVSSFISPSKKRIFNSSPQASNPCDADYLIDDVSIPLGCSGIGGKAGPQKTTCRSNRAKVLSKSGGGLGTFFGKWVDANGNTVSPPTGVTWTTGGSDAQGTAPPSGVVWKDAKQVIKELKGADKKWAMWSDYKNSNCLEQNVQPATENTGGVSGRSNSDHIMIQFKDGIGTWGPKFSGFGLLRWSSDKKTAALQLGSGKTYIFINANCKKSSFSVNGNAQEIISKANACADPVYNNNGGNNGGSSDSDCSDKNRDENADGTCGSCSSGYVENDDGVCEEEEGEGNSKLLLIGGGVAVAAVIYFLM